MPITIARLRLWILLTAVVLVAAIVFSIGYARHQLRQAINDLPGKLGGQIESSSDGFTYSQSVKGRTAFTLHASKAVKFKGGSSATLHDVIITLYGAQGDRSDRISGSEFDYDQKAGLISAKGEVQIDLQGVDLSASAVKSAGEAAGKLPGKDTNKGKDIAVAAAPAVIHIKTSGLTFNQGTQVATTSQHVEFSTPKGAGQATGAVYDVQHGLLTLQSAVELNSDRDGVPILVRASHAEFLRSSMQAFLLNPVTKYKTEQTSADQAIVYFRKDGSAEHIDAQGHVDLKTDEGQQMTCRAAKILLDQRSQPSRADASGGVNFVSLGNLQGDRPSDRHQMHGNAVEGTLLFARGGTLTHAQARNAVSFVDQQQGLGDDPQGSATRELRATQVDVDFTPDSSGRAVADKVLAVGGATAVLHTIRTKGAAQNTTIKGDQLVASLRGGRAIDSLHGSGHTSVLDIAPSGATNLSTGDTLQVNFTPARGQTVPVATAKAATATAASLDATQIQSVVQEGNVVMVQTPAHEDGKPLVPPTRIVARRADYDAASQLLRLTGSPRIDDGATNIAADSIDYHRDTQAANAVGNVKATYVQPPAAGQASKTTTAPGFGGEGPTHVVSSSAVLDQARGVATFRGQARVWQGGNSVSAPVIELSRNPQSLKAYAEPAAANAVSTVIASSPGAQRQPDVFRITSRQLLFVDSDHKAIFTGSVVAADPSGVVRSDQVEVFLSQAKQLTAAPDAPSRVDRVVATGHVVVQQPGRRGTGEKLLYTAQDGKFVLTGTFSAPPHLYDQVHGNVSGEALNFNSQDDSVSVTGGQSKAVTNTRTAK